MLNLKVVKAEPGNLKFHVGLGNQYRASSMLEKAADSYRKALKIGQDDEASTALSAVLSESAK